MVSSKKSGNSEGCKAPRAQNAKRRMWKCEDRKSGEVAKVARACKDAEHARGAKVCRSAERV